MELGNIIGSVLIKSAQKYSQVCAYRCSLFPRPMDNQPITHSSLNGQLIKPCTDLGHILTAGKFPWKTPGWMVIIACGDLDP